MQTIKQWVFISQVWSNLVKIAPFVKKKDYKSEKAVASSKILGESLFFDISSFLTSPFGGKKHLLLIIEVSTDYAWRIFLKEKIELKSDDGPNYKFKN